jgi:hypothetical protein
MQYKLEEILAGAAAVTRTALVDFRAFAGGF